MGEAVSDVKRILREAADLIGTSGWAQHVYEQGDGSFCAVGAIRKVAHGDSWQGRNLSEKAQGVLADALREAGVEDPRDYDYGVWPDPYAEELRNYNLITEWNDDDQRTADEVIRVLREAGQG